MVETSCSRHPRLDELGCGAERSGRCAGRRLVVEGGGGRREESRGRVAVTSSRRSLVTQPLSLPTPAHGLLSSSPLSSPMAQTATMGPPLSPRETRRSGRRSAPSHSTSTSTSPDSAPDIANTTHTNNNGAPTHITSTNHHRPALSSANNSSRSNKRNKREGTDETALDESHKHGTNTTASVAGQNGRTKRKGKEKDKPVVQDVPVELVPPPTDTPADATMDLEGEGPPEEDSVTRCVCGSTGAYLFSFFSPLSLPFSLL